jgi:iron complex outermembrane receptor protein
MPNSRCTPRLELSTFLAKAVPAVFLEGFLVFLLLVSAPLQPATAQTAEEAPEEPTASPLSEMEDAAEADLGDLEPSKPDPDLVMPSGIDVITVTAEKRSSSLQETPMAITALTGAELFNRGVYDVEALASQVPNFHYGESFGISRITIRGVSVQGFNDPSTTFHIDGLYQNNPTAASALTFYDVQQVEVLRGPQGTLWGRNSTAGSINVSTRQPIHEFEMFGDVLVGSYSQVFARAVVNAPLVEDRVASRVAFYVDKRDGYQKNLYGPRKGQDANDADNWGIRPQVLFDLTQDLNVTVRGGYNHQGGVGWSNKTEGPYPPGGFPFLYPLLEDALPAPGNQTLFVGPFYLTEVSPEYGDIRPNPKNPRKIRANADRYQDVSTWNVNATVNWDLYDVPLLGDVFFNAVAGYKEENRTARFDVDLSEQDLFESNISASTVDRVLDLHFRNAGDTSTDWLVGFFLLDADGRLEIGLPGRGGVANIYTGPLATITGNPFLNPLLRNKIITLSGGFIEAENESFSVASYAHVKQKFFEDRFNVGLGLRYNYDSKTGFRAGDEVLGTLAPLLVDGCLTPAYRSRIRDRWDGVTGDFKAEFLPTDEHMVYGSIARGYKPGYINGDSVSTDCDAPPVLIPNAKDEGIWAFEVGSKNQFFNDHLVANLTGFYYLYDNLQVLEQANQVTVTQNAREARLWGIEFEGIWRPVQNLTLTTIYGYLNAYYEDYFGYDYAIGEPADFSGNRMIQAPKHTATLSADYTLPLGDYGTLTSRVQYFVSDEVYFGAANDPADRQPNYELLQLRMRWDAPTEDFFIEGFVQNLTDEDVQSNRSIGLTLLDRPRTASYEPPRTWGVRIGGTL